ncbi:MAG: twin-arginine translocation signal domain-containing protein [Sphingobacteriia bacterium]|nr:twin-arginine translocation signal domain-containing protein [Sphingobacteriia bacterium]
MSNQLTRRKFIKTAAASAVGVAVFPQFLASCKQPLHGSRERNGGGCV